MILIDYNQIVISNLMQQIHGSAKMKIEEDLVRHMVLNSLRMYIQKFKREYGEVVICCDSRKYWRRSVFPYYKAHRKKNRDKSDINWPTVFDILEKIRGELIENLPHKVIQVEGAEADDIIATLTKRYAPSEKVMIVSSDKDFVQLQALPNVEQWSQIHKEKIYCSDPQAFLKEHIIRGDQGDGIPNILSPSDTYVSGVRSKPINSKKLANWINQPVETFCTNESMLAGYKRNEMLIDLNCIPDAVSACIVNAYENATKGSMAKMMNYFIEKRLKNLMESLSDFK